MSNEETGDKAAAFDFSSEEQLRPGVDPKAQNIIRAVNSADAKEALRHEGLEGGVVDVAALLHDPELDIEGLDVLQRAGNMVIGRVRADQLERVVSHPNVVRLEVARKLHPTLERSVFEIRANREQIRAEMFEGAVPFDGSGVIVGVIDHGCDFVHQNFRVIREGAALATTRLLYLWDQYGTPPKNPPPGHPKFGRESDSAAINLALTKEAESETAPYDFLGYTPPQTDAHGTFVLDVAAGNGRTTCARGVAPGADIIFVDLATDNPQGTGSLGNSVMMIHAVTYVFDKAGARPAVVNISITARDGPHDGSTLVERWMDYLLQTPGRAVVIASGNFRHTLGHAVGRLERDKGRTLKWRIREGDKTPNELEIWYDGRRAIELALRSPDGTLNVSAPFGRVTKIRLGGKEVGSINHGESYTDNEAKLASISFSTQMPSGEWSISLKSDDADPVDFHAWIAGDRFGQSTFAEEDADPLFTLGTIACGSLPIVVGSYDPLKPHPFAPDSSSGPTRDYKQKPEVSAPGIAIRTAHARAGDTIESSGTSLAAPHVTGAIALMMQAAGELLPVETVREAVSSHARRCPPDGESWHPAYGNGRIDALASVLAVAERAALYLSSVKL